MLRRHFCVLGLLGLCVACLILQYEMVLRAMLQVVNSSGFVGHVISTDARLHRSREFVCSGHVIGGCVYQVKECCFCCADTCQSRSEPWSSDGGYGSGTVAYRV